MRIESWLKSVASRPWALRREEERGLREMLRLRNVQAVERDVEDVGCETSLPLPRQSGFARGGS
jgi:hypothetical protein